MTVWRNPDQERTNQNARIYLKTTLPYDKYMLFAGQEVRIVKNCDRGLENAARGHSVSLCGPTLSQQITIFFCDKLADKWVYATFFIELAYRCRLQTIVKNPTRERASNSDTRQILKKMY